MRLINKFFGGLILILIAIIFIQRCNLNSQIDLKASELKTLQDQKFRIENDVIIQKTIIAKTNAELKNYMSELFTLSIDNANLKKELKNYKKISTIIKITDTLILKDTIYATVFEVDKLLKFNKTTDFYIFNATLKDSILTIDSLLVPNNTDIVIGDRKIGYFKLRKEHTVSIIHSNPLIHTTSVNSIVFKPKKKWYEKQWVYFAGGLVAGSFLILKTN